MATKPSTALRTIEWVGDLDGHVRMIDQTKLPEELTYLECQDVETVWQAIKRLSVRGAPAIGIAGAMGLVLAVRKHPDDDAEGFKAALAKSAEYLAGCRPTAVNLGWALRRMTDLAGRNAERSVAEIKNILLEESKRIRDEDAAMCRSIGEHGVSLLSSGDGVLTHCNAGGLATAEYGTALAPIYVGHEKGLGLHVFADETRPLLQGARLTAWELAQAGVEVTVLCDNMAADLMRSGKVNVVITGADRIAANGDVANKIGTYGVAVLAKAHGIPFYVAAPSSTFDFDCPSGDAIPIEYRGDEEVRSGFGRTTVPAGVPCHCPAFDVTPATYVAGLITEKGVIKPVNAENIASRLK